MPDKRFVNIHVTKILNSGIIIPFVDKIMYGDRVTQLLNVSFISTKRRSQRPHDLWRRTADARF